MEGRNQADAMGYHFVKVYLEAEPPSSHYKTLGLGRLSFKKRHTYTYFYKALMVYLGYWHVCNAASEEQGLIFLKYFDEKMQKERSANEMLLYKSHFSHIAGLALAGEGGSADPIYIITLDMIREVCGGDEAAARSMYAIYHGLKTGRIASLASSFSLKSITAPA